MARRNGRKNNYLASDDYSGFTCYASELQKDYWGNYVKRPLLRNLQEIASPLADPYPVDVYRGPVYENTTICQFELQPLFIGTTTTRTPITLTTFVLGFNPGVGTASIGCTFRIS